MLLFPVLIKEANCPHSILKCETLYMPLFMMYWNSSTALTLEGYFCGKSIQRNRVYDRRLRATNTTIISNKWFKSSSQFVQFNGQVRVTTLLKPSE
jgi:hypothetical protein